MQKRRKLKKAAWVAGCAIFAAGNGTGRWAWGTTYYVSPTGSDSNGGTSASSPWQSVAKVDGTTFNPGDQILFQDGGNWYGSLSASSSGTVSAPITYGSYGSGADPIFWGSNIVPAQSFQAVTGAGSTYTYSTSAPVTSFFVNDQFTHSASLVSGQTTDAGNISYVENNPNSWYYDSTTSQLYVNTGGKIAAGNGSTYSATVRSNAIESNFQNNLVFQGLETNETAAYNGGYGIHIDASNNVVVQNCVALNGGKHNVAVIDSNATINKTVASGVMPDQGVGGATAFVSYSDSTHTGNVSVYNNDTVTNYPNEPAFYDHADNPTALTAITLNNFISNGSAVSVGLGTSDHVQINGGTVINAPLTLGGNTTANGVTITGPNAYITMTGSNNTVQNTVVAGVVPTNPYLGAIVDQGTNDIVRYSTIMISPTASTSSTDIELASAQSFFSAYGNVLVSPGSLLQTYYQLINSPAFGAPNDFSLAYNVYDSDPNNQFADINGFSPLTLAQMQAMGLDTGSLFGVPLFVNPSTGQYALLSSSPGVGLVPLNSTTAGDLYDILGQPRPQSGYDNAGAYTSVNLVWNNSGGGNGTTWDATNVNWTNNSAADVYTDGANVTFNTSNNGHNAVTLNTTVYPASVSFRGSNNYTLSGTGGIAGGGSLGKYGVGTLSLNVANSYTGGTTVNAGTLVAGVNGALGEGPVTINGGLLQLGTSTGTAQMTSLSISGNGTLDVNNNEIIITYSGSSPIATIKGYIISGYNGGAWNGPGIISTAARGNLKYGVGYADSADAGNPAQLASGTIEVRYTLLGDADLNGIVNGIDFGILAANLNKGVTGWDQGDFDYNNIVNGFDFALLVGNFDKGASGASVGVPAWADPSLVAFAQANGLMADLPEPGGVVLGVAAGGMILRRRRKFGRA